MRYSWSDHQTTFWGMSHSQLPTRASSWASPSWRRARVSSDSASAKRCSSSSIRTEDSLVAGIRAGPAPPIARCYPACPLARDEVVVHLVDLRLRCLYADLLRVRADLLLGELVELLLRLPHVDDVEPVGGLGHPMEQSSVRGVTARLEPHLLDDLVVLLERPAGEVHDDCDGHADPPELKAAGVATLTGRRTRDKRSSGCGGARAHGARHASAAQSAVAAGVLGEVLLVVVLGVVERPGLGDLGGDLAQPRLVQRRLVAIA